MPSIHLRNVSSELHRLIHKASQDDFFKRRESGELAKNQKPSTTRWILKAIEDRLKRDGYL